MKAAGMLTPTRGTPEEPYLKDYRKKYFTLIL